MGGETSWSAVLPPSQLTEPFNGPRSRGSHPPWAVQPSSQSLGTTRLGFGGQNETIRTQTSLRFPPLSPARVHFPCSRYSGCCFLPPTQTLTCSHPAEQQLITRGFHADPLCPALWVESRNVRDSGPQPLDESPITGSNPVNLESLFFLVNVTPGSNFLFFSRDRCLSISCANAGANRAAESATPGTT